MRRIALAAAVLGMATPGCRTVAPIAGTMLGGGRSGYSYRAGRATQVFSYPPSTLEPAVVAAMDDLRIGSVRKGLDGGVLRIEGTTPDRRTATVLIRPQQGASRVIVQVGWFGDEPLARALMDRLGVRLGTLPPSAIPAEPPSAPASNPYFSRDAVPDEIMLRDQEAGYRDSPVP
ncbi:MAG TPA: DUF3568 family protein [Isosphaeraceae bacterium]|nr:DUF3568 family protein [Isosphaeraceae bacterium]